MKPRIVLLITLLLGAVPLAATADTGAAKSVVAIIGTGDMGDSLGPRFAQLGYPVVYGSRDPQGEKAQRVAAMTGADIPVTSQREAAQAGDIVILAVPPRNRWRASL
jgi:predicted dinucleotide-binding enzyme